MIIAADRIYGVSARCADGFLGEVDDLLFDDRSWNVTFLVVRFGRWWNRQRVLVNPADVDAADWLAGRLHLSLTGNELQAAPSLETNLPVAMRKARELRVVALDAYWSGMLEVIDQGDPHLRNTRAVTGHHVVGLDAEAGFVDDFVIDDRAWSIRYLVVRIGRWRINKRVVLEPRWVDSIIWEERGVHIHLPKAEIAQGREFTFDDMRAPH